MALKILKGHKWNQKEALKRVKDWATNEDSVLDDDKFNKAFIRTKDSDVSVLIADVVNDELVTSQEAIESATRTIEELDNIDDETKEDYLAQLESYRKSLAQDEEESEENDDANEKRTVKASYDAKTKIAIASTSIEDRHGEKIDQNGWDLKNFKNNPVLLWAHDHNEISVGNARNIHIERSSGTPKLVFTPDFHEATDKARALKTLYEEGRLNSFSVGFIPKEFDGKDSTYLKQELLEISAVNVPANPDARTMSYKTLLSKGFKKDVAKEVVGIEETENTTDSKKDFKKLLENLKGALADMLEEHEEEEVKMHMMKPLHEIYWAFCDLYYSEETKVEDFNKLLGEFITEIEKLKAEDMKPSTDEDEMPEDKQVLDKISALSESINKINNKVDTLVKAQENTETSTAPKANLTKEERAKQSLGKVIAKASDKLLKDNKENADKASNQDLTKQLKVIKKAAEILNQASKK